MTEIKGNIWDYHRVGGYVVVPTNGFVKKNGMAVMGRGLAQQCARKFPQMPASLGTCLQIWGNQVIEYPDPMRIFTFPVKHNWWEKADMGLIARSCNEIMHILEQRKLNVYIPRVGCGNGQLPWEVVKPILFQLLDDRFMVVDQAGGSK